jgi:hypothetical protein
MAAMATYVQHDGLCKHYLMEYLFQFLVPRQQHMSQSSFKILCFENLEKMVVTGQLVKGKMRADLKLSILFLCDKKTYLINYTIVIPISNNWMIK